MLKIVVPLPSEHELQVKCPGSRVYLKLEQEVCQTDATAWPYLEAWLFQV